MKLKRIRKCGWNVLVNGTSVGFMIQDRDEEDKPFYRVYEFPWEEKYNDSEEFNRMCGGDLDYFTRTRRVAIECLTSEPERKKEVMGSFVNDLRKEGLIIPEREEKMSEKKECKGCGNFRPILNTVFPNQKCQCGCYQNKGRARVKCSCGAIWHNQVKRCQNKACSKPLGKDRAEAKVEWVKEEKPVETKIEQPKVETKSKVQLSVVLGLDYDTFPDNLIASFFDIVSFETAHTMIARIAKQLDALAYYEF